LSGGRFFILINRRGDLPQCQEIWVKEEMARPLNPIAKKLNIRYVSFQKLPLLDAA
jgi:hypothetical protein